MRSYKAIVLLLGFIACLSQTTAVPRNARIIGGETAAAGQFPYAAAIHVQTSNSKFFCGGTLIGSDWVITAGHCVYNAVLFTIQLGSNHLESDDPYRETVATSTYIIHPEFNPETIENDIGLIRFRSPVMFNTYLSPANIMSVHLEDSIIASALGWGQISDSEPELSNDLRYVSVSTISNAECQITYGSQITENMVCVIGNYNEGTCTGDNGSPLIARFGKYNTIVGIASFISANGCESTNPSGYTRIFPYYNWIMNNTRT